jgi:hypothetical protein
MASEFSGACDHQLRPGPRNLSSLLDLVAYTDASIEEVELWLI